jgi:hypothetical protein
MNAQTPWAICALVNEYNFRMNQYCTMPEQAQQAAAQLLYVYASDPKAYNL